MRNLILLITFFACLFSTSTIYGKHDPKELKKYVFKINGKVTYKDKLEGNTKIKGLYGVTMVLHMLKKGDGMIAPLTGSGIDSKDVKVSLQPDGSFSFNLQMLSNLSMYDRIFLEIYPGDTHGSINYDSLQYITKSSVGKITVWNQQVEGLPFRGIELPFDENQMNHEFHNIQMEVMTNFGDAARYLKISNEFGKWFFKKLNKNINIPPITVGLVKEFKKKKEGKADGYFWPHGNPFIEINFSIHSGTNIVTCHEYGHYLHSLLNPGNFSVVQSNRAFKNKEIVWYHEAVADFFGMATRKYGEVIHGDPSFFTDNFEQLPFTDPPYKYCNYCRVEGHKGPYWAAYLWNIFDGPSLTFDKPGYITYDNDDIDGDKDGWYKEVFKIISTLTTYSDFKVKEYLLNPIIAQNQDLINSVENIYKFLLVDDQQPMRSAQVRSVKLTDGSSKEYHSIAIEKGSYPGLDVNYKNMPTGYRLYGKKGNNWILIKEIEDKSESSIKTFSIATEAIAPYKDFKLTVFNKSGESLHPYEFTESSLPIEIEGPKDIFAGILNQWKANITGGVQPIIYYWKMRKLNSSDDYFDKKQAGYSPYFSATAPEGQSFILEVFAIDGNETTAYAEMQVNTTIKPLKGNILGIPFVTANQTNEWEAEITGGVPPYTYSWVKQIDGHPALNFISNQSSCNTKSDKPFTLKLSVKDSKGSAIIVEKPIQINILAPIVPAIDGAKLVYLHENTSSWKADVIGGMPPYEISWYRKYDHEYSYSFVTKGDTYQKNYGGGEGVFYLKAIIKDANGIVKESDPFKVTSLYQPLYTSIVNENIVLKPGDKITWQADIAGGKPTYHCTWKVGKDLNNLTTIKEGYIGYEFHPSCEYQPKFNDGGNHIITLTVKDALGKSITIHKNFTVQTMDISNSNSQPSLLTIYPNPAPGTFTLNYTVAEDANVMISLVSVNDNKETILYQQQNMKGSYNKNFNTTILPIGNYILKYIQKDAKGKVTVTTEKIMLLK